MLNKIANRALEKNIKIKTMLLDMEWSKSVKLTVWFVAILVFIALSITNFSWTSHVLSPLEKPEWVKTGCEEQLDVRYEFCMIYDQMNEDIDEFNRNNRNYNFISAWALLFAAVIAVMGFIDEWNR